MELFWNRIGMAYYGSGVIPTSHDSQFYKNSVRNGGTTKFHRGGSWTTFLQKVWTRCEADGLQNGEVSIDEIFQRGFEYFKHVQSSTLSETVVQFGVVAWEQCSNLNAELLPLKSVIDNTVSAGFRSMHFRRFDKLGRNRVDFVARLLTSSDSPPSLVPLGKSPVPLSPASTSALPVWRNSPMNTVAVVSLLTEPKFDVDAAVCQVAHFCECPLRVTPNRKVVFGVATNFQVCVFVAVVVTGEGSYRKYRTYHSSLIEKDVPEQLARFAATSPEALGVTWRFPTSLFEPTQFLGRGSTSWAMSGIWRRQQLVMKLSVQPAAIEVERQLLAYLHSCEDVQLSASIPQIHAEAQAELYPLCQQACSVFTERYELNAPLTEAHMLELWAILCKLHQYGVVHRDVRPPNIVQSARTTDYARSDGGTGAVVLIDFSSASFYATTDEEEKEEVAQRFQQANNGVQMRSLMEGNKFETMPVSTSSDAVLRGADNLPADEACALIYCALQEIFPEVDLLFAINSLGENYDFFIKSRGDDFFWEELTVDDPMAGPLKMTIRAALRNLLAMRESCTEAQRTAEVQAAVGAVYRLKPFKFKC